MSILYWRPIEKGRWVSGPFEIRKSVFGSKQWMVFYRGLHIGFRPTLALAKGLAERQRRAA